MTKPAKTDLQSDCKHHAEFKDIQDCHYKPETAGDEADLWPDSVPQKSFFDPKPKLQFSVPQKLRYVDQDCLQAVLKKHYTLWKNDRHYLALKRILYSAVKYTLLITTWSSLQNELESHCTKYKGELRSEQESSGWNNVNCKQFKEVPAETEMHETCLLTKFGYWEFKGLEAFFKEDTDACLTGLYEVTPQAEAVESNIGKLLHT